MLSDRCLSVLSVCNVGVLGQMVEWIKIKVDMQVGFGRGHIVLDEDPAPGPPPKGHSPRRLCVRWGPSSPSQKKRRSPQFSVHFYCSKTAGCIKMPFGTEVGLGPGDFVSDGDPP